MFWTLCLKILAELRSILASGKRSSSWQVCWVLCFLVVFVDPAPCLSLCTRCSRGSMVTETICYRTLCMALESPTRWFRTFQRWELNQIQIRSLQSLLLRSKTANMFHLCYTSVSHRPLKIWRTERVWRRWRRLRMTETQRTERRTLRNTSAECPPSRAYSLSTDCVRSVHRANRERLRLVSLVIQQNLIVEIWLFSNWIKTNKSRTFWLTFGTLLWYICFVDRKWRSKSYCRRAVARWGNPRVFQTSTMWVQLVNDHACCLWDRSTFHGWRWQNPPPQTFEKTHTDEIPASLRCLSSPDCANAWWPRCYNVQFLSPQKTKEEVSCSWQRGKQGSDLFACAVHCRQIGSFLPRAKTTVVPTSFKWTNCGEGFTTLFCLHGVVLVHWDTFWWGHCPFDKVLVDVMLNRWMSC